MRQCDKVGTREVDIVSPQMTHPTVKTINGNQQFCSYFEAFVFTSFLSQWGWIYKKKWTNIDFSQMA